MNSYTVFRNNSSVKGIASPRQTVEPDIAQITNYELAPVSTNTLKHPKEYLQYLAYVIQPTGV